MGQKVNPYGFRLGVTTDWKSRWIAGKKEFREQLIEDSRIRDYLRKELERAAVSRVEIERTSVSRARRFPLQAANYLAAHTEDWERPTLRAVVPKRILAVVREDQFEIADLGATKKTCTKAMMTTEADGA